MTDTAQMKEIRSNKKIMQMGLREIRSQCYSQEQTYQGKGKNTPEKKTHTHTHTSFLQLITARSTTQCSRYVLSVPSFSCSYVEL